MLKKLNQITNITIGSFVGVFIGCGIYVFCDYKKHGIASGKRKKPENHLVASDIF